MPAPAAPAPGALPANAAVLHAFADRTRWRLLGELVRSEPLMVRELAQRLGLPGTNVSKHVNTLRRAGLVERGRGDLYAIPARFLNPDQPGVVDYGCVALRFEAPTPAD